MQHIYAKGHMRIYHMQDLFCICPHAIYKCIVFILFNFLNNITIYTTQEYSNQTRQYCVSTTLKPHPCGVNLLLCQYVLQRSDQSWNQHIYHVWQYRAYPCAVGYHHREGDQQGSLLHHEPKRTRTNNKVRNKYISMCIKCTVVECGTTSLSDYKIR